MKKTFLRNTAAVMAVISFIILAPITVTAEDDINLEYLKSIMDMVREKYGDEITERELIEGALEGIFNTMDAYTTYYTNDEAEDFISYLEGSYEGVGVSLEVHDRGAVILKVFESSPAEEAGLLQGDIITGIDGQEIEGMSIDQIAALMRGESGTGVAINIKRRGKANPLSFHITRGSIEINPVTYEIRDDGIGYIRLEMFNSHSSKYAGKALDAMDEENVSRIIFDIRGNPGGELGQAVSIARNFVPDGLVTIVDYKSENKQDVPYWSYLEDVKYELVLLVNGMSASASEILAGAVQDRESGTLVGTNTFGKALVQELIPILTPEAYEKYRSELGVSVVSAYDLYDSGITPDYDEIMGWSKITTAVYRTPSGRVIDENGIEPDVYVQDPEMVNGIDIVNMTRLAKRATPGLYSQGETVYNAECILAAIGYDIDPPDMLLDNKTYIAIRDFQRENGLYAYGVLDYATQDALNQELEMVVMEYDCQYVKAVKLLGGNTD